MDSIVRTMIPQHLQDIYIAVVRWKACISVGYIGNNIYALYFFSSDGKPDKLLGPEKTCIEDHLDQYKRFLKERWRQRRLKVKQAGRELL